MGVHTGSGSSSGTMGHAPLKLVTVWRKAVRVVWVAFVMTQCFELAGIKFVAYSPPGKTIFSHFSALFYVNSSAFDWVTGSLKCQTRQSTRDLSWMYYSAEENTKNDRRMHQNTHFDTQKLKTIMRPDPSPNGRKTPPPHTPPSYSRRLRRSTCPSKPNPGSAAGIYVKELNRWTWCVSSSEGSCSFVSDILYRVYVLEFISYIWHLCFVCCSSSSICLSTL